MYLRFLTAVGSGNTGPTSIDTAGTGPRVGLVLPIVGTVTVPIIDGRCGESSENGSVGKASTSDRLPPVVGRCHCSDQKGGCEECRSQVGHGAG
jgi:hypothetical protein